MSANNFSNHSNKESEVISPQVTGNQSASQIITAPEQSGVQQQQRIEALERDLQRVRDALEMFYDKWENGDSCYEARECAA